MSIYREKLLDHYNSPRNFGPMVVADAEVTLANLSCGDTITIFVKEKQGKLTDISFQGEGCAVAIACASMLTEIASGMSLVDAEKLDLDTFLESIGLEFTISRLKCAGLGLEALKECTRKIVAKNK